MANGQIKLLILDIVGNPIWVSTEDGQKVHDKIVQAFKHDRSVSLSFANCGTVITAFLNAAIGQLYNGVYPEKFIEEHLDYTDIHDEDKDMVARVIANAKKYFANREGYDQAWKEVVDDDEEEK